MSAWLFGGAGDDGLNSGMGNDAVFGGDGRDNVKGGNGGNDWLVGGLGRDKLDGKRGEAILVGGSTAADDLSAISSIMQRLGWPRALRRSCERVPTAAFPFYLGAATVFDDAAVDSLKEREQPGLVHRRCGRHAFGLRGGGGEWSVSIGPTRAPPAARRGPSGIRPRSGGAAG